MNFGADQYDTEEWVLPPAGWDGDGDGARRASQAGKLTELKGFDE